jgi:hypothetical protein
MKKVIKLSESELVSIIKKIIKEQQEFGESNPSTCLKVHISFMFKKSVMVNGMVQDGGDLALWNKSNQIPDPSDKSAYNRFVKLLKEYVDGNYFGFEECEGVTFEEIKPLIKDMYLAEIEKHSGSDDINKLTSGFIDNMKKFDDVPAAWLRRRLSLYGDEIDRMIDNSDASIYSDEFEYADNMIYRIIEDLRLEALPEYTDDMVNDVFDFIKNVYGDILLNAYYENGGEGLDYEY